MAIRIITDSAADFDREVAKRRKIDIVSLSVQFGSASFLDGKNLTTEVFYKLLKEGKENPKTAQPSPADFLTLFEEAKAAGDQVVVVSLSGALSGTLQSASIAKDMCEYEPIYIVDSRSATAGMQILVNYACKLRDSGLPAQDIAAQLEQLRGKIRIFAMVDTLEYLRRGGPALRHPGGHRHRHQAQAHHHRPGRRGGRGRQSLRHRRRGEDPAEADGGTPCGRRLPLLLPLYR